MKRRGFLGACVGAIAGGLAGLFGTARAAPRYHRITLRPTKGFCCRDCASEPSTAVLTIYEGDRVIARWFWKDGNLERIHE